MNPFDKQLGTYMSKNDMMVHAIKTTQSGCVNTLSVAFTKRSVSITDIFRNRLCDTLAQQIKTFGPIQVHSKHNSDNWFIVFKNPCNEAALDNLLITIATELQAKIYIEPGVPEQEQKRFKFFIKPHERRSNN